MSQNPAARNITEGVIWKQLLSFFFPILLGTFFQQMYNTVDTIIVGRFVGTQALAAVGSTGALISLLNGFCIGLASGATVLVSQFFGAGDQPSVKKALHTGIGLALVLGLLISFCGLCFGPQILRLMKTPEDCLDGALVYARIFFSGAVASMIYNMGAGILRFSTHHYKNIADWVEPDSAEALLYEGETYHLAGEIGESGLSSKKFPTDKILGEVTPESFWEPAAPFVVWSVEGKAKQDHPYDEQGVSEFDMYTETLAQIYLEQGYPEQARHIYSKLLLANPEKNAYFAALIQKIDELNQ